MISTRRKTWYTLLMAAGSYVFFGLQFFVSSDDSFELLSGILKRFNLDASGVHNKPLAVAIALLPIYVLIVWMARYLFFDLYARLTIETRFQTFANAIEKISRYHRRNVADETVAFLKKPGTKPALERVKAISNTMIDLLITDLRDAFQELCVCSDVRVAVYAAGYPSGGSRSSVQLYMRNTTEFDLDLDNSLIFKCKNGLFEGYCGKAWATMEPQSGTFRLLPFLPFVNDKTFLQGNAFDKTRSFLCLPVVVKTAKGLRPLAVLCIDSGRRIDFAMGNDLRDKISSHVMDLHSYLAKYVRWPDN